MGRPPRPQSLFTPTKEEVRETALRVVNILEQYGLSCCIIGSAATSAWGASRTPKDVDMVIMTRSHSEEGIKRLITASDTTFYLVSSTNPRNSYKILWHRYPSISRAGLAIKIDILVPPTLNIPFVEPHLVTTRNSLPIMPLLPLLLLKLQGWDDHRLSAYNDKRMKKYVYAEDVEELLAIALREGVGRYDDPWLPSTFEMRGELRISSFVRENPGTRGSWRQIGFSC